MQKIIERASDYRSFHESVRKGDVENVKNFIDKYPLDKQVFNCERESAVAIALRSEKFEVYETLIVNGFRLGLKEMFEKIMEELDAKQMGDETAYAKREKLRQIHNKHVKNSTLNHLHNFNAKSKLSHNTDEAYRRELHERIAKAFEELNECAGLELVLKIVSTADNLQIIFDFHRVSVDHMDPTKHDNVFGSTYPLSLLFTLARSFCLMTNNARKSTEL